MDSTTYVEIPRAISGVKAVQAVEKMQGEWSHIAGNVINHLYQARVDYQMAARDAINSLDASHERAYELGGVIDATSKLGQMEAAAESLHQVITRGAFQRKRKSSSLAEEMKSASGLSEEARHPPTTERSERENTDPQIRESS